MRIESLRDLLAQFPDIDGFWGSGDLAATESAIRQKLLAPGDDQLNLEPTTEAIEVLIQLIRVLDLQGKTTEARTALDQARQLLPVVEKPAQRRGEVRLLIEQGRHLCLAMMPAKAQSPLMQAWILASEISEPFFAIEAALLLAVIQPPKNQNEWLQRALGLAEAAQNPEAQLWLAQLHLMNGWRSFDLHHFEEALKSFNQALARPRAQGERTEILGIKWAVARALRALNRFQEALDIQQELLAEFNRIGKVDGHVFLEIGECLQLLQRVEEAKPYFESAHRELSGDNWYADNNGEALSRMREIFKKR